MTPTPEQLAALLPALGIKLTTEDLETRVVESIVDRILGEESADLDLDDVSDPDDDDYRPSRYGSRLRDKAMSAIRDRLDASVERYFAAAFPEDKLDAITRSIMFPATNSYGEKKGEPQTLLEHFEKRAIDYIRESVDYRGEKSSSYDRGQPRLMWMLERQYKHNLEQAIKSALDGIHAELAKQINATVQNVVSAVKVTVGR